MRLVIVKRDLVLGARSGGAWLYGILFFFVFLTLCAIALGGDLSVMRPLAPALIWLSVILSIMLSFSQIFHTDFSDGSLEHLLLSKSALKICISKSVSFGCLAILPLILAAPLAAIIFDLGASVIIGLCLSLIFALPALSVYGVMASAIMATRGGTGFLMVLITAPFLIPVLIFGLAAVDSYGAHGLLATEFRALAGLSLIACAIGLPAAGAALTTNME